MKKCQTCRYGNEYELDKPCIVYREDCPLYEKEGDGMTNNCDLISREAVLDLLEDTNNGWVINEVLQLPSVRPQEPKWIPVSERLPEKDRKHNTFLVTDSDGNLSISKFYLPLSNSDIEKPYWSGMIDVKAWMPLPKPYEPKESEDEG